MLREVSGVPQGLGEGLVLVQTGFSHEWAEAIVPAGFRPAGKREVGIVVNGETGLNAPGRHSSVRAGKLLRSGWLRVATLSWSASSWSASQAQRGPADRLKPQAL